MAEQRAARSAEVLLNSAALASSAFAQTAALDYWDMCRAKHQAVVEAMTAEGDAGVQIALAAVASCAADSASLAALSRALLNCLSQKPDALRNAVQLAMRADNQSRLVMAAGLPLEPVPEVRVEEMVERPSLSTGGRDPSSAKAIVVIPFRDRSLDRGRLRNLLAVIASLQLQTAARDMYRIVVVESDDVPRFRNVLLPLVDAYIHAPASGHFNKAWAVNVGVVQESAPAQLICVLDADVLVDADFIVRNVRRFDARGTQAHWPFLDALCLDGPSSDRAIRSRLSGGAVVVSEMYGVHLRRPPGHCLWVRREAFFRIQGFDERFEGWGGEDLDFVFRLQFVAPLDRYEDSLLHLHHPRPQVTKPDGRRFYEERTLLSWYPTTPIGQPSGPATSGDLPLAALLETEPDEVRS